MTIEKIYKLTIKNSTYNLTEEEITSLYESCRKALNISYIGPIPSIPSIPSIISTVALDTYMYSTFQRAIRERGPAAIGKKQKHTP